MARGKITVILVLGGAIQIGVTDDKDIIRFFEDKETKLKNMKQPLEKYGEYLVTDHIVRQFAQQGFPKRWAQLSPEYAKWKRRHYPGRKILELTGKMKGGFRVDAGPKSMRIVNRVTAGQRRNKIPRWEWHQYGTGIMPARPMLQITEDDMAELTDIVFAWLDE
jgi:phage gpG-like protein